jgi:hypothetical protein
MLHLTAKFAHDVFDLSHCSVEGLPDRDQRVFALGRVGMGLVDDDLVVLGHRYAKLDLEAAAPMSALRPGDDDATTTAPRIASEAEDSGTRGAASLPDLDLGFPAGHQWTAIGAFSKISASRARVAIVVPCGSIERGKNRASRISQSGFRSPRIRNLRTRYTTT